MSYKPSGGLVVVDPERYANVSHYGVDRIALKVAWADIEPVQGVFDYTYIYDHLDRFPDTKFTIRVQAGDSSPQWLKTITGGAIQVYNKARNRTSYVHRWWTSVGMDAWDTMIHALGAEFDTHQRIVMVSACAQTVVYSEPFILGSDHPSGVRLFNAGLDEDTQRDSIIRCVDDTCDAFPNTLVELAIHKYLQIPHAEGIRFSWPDGRALANTVASAHGDHLLLSDYGLKTADRFAVHEPGEGENMDNTSDVYTYMYLRTHPTSGARRGPIGFQLTVGREVQDYNTYMQAAQNAADLGAWQCETAGWGLLEHSVPYYDTLLKNNSLAGWDYINGEGPELDDDEGVRMLLFASGAWIPRRLITLS